MRVRPPCRGRVAHLPQKPKCYEIVCETVDNIISFGRSSVNTARYADFVSPRGETGSPNTETGVRQ